MKYFQIFIDEARPDKQVIGLEARDFAEDSTVYALDQTVQEGVAVK